MKNYYTFLDTDSLCQLNLRNSFRLCRLGSLLKGLDSDVVTKRSLRFWTSFVLILVLSMKTEVLECRYSLLDGGWTKSGTRYLGTIS
jgi:hypothetical protein